MMIDAPRKPRPYWHVDLKWISGIVLFFALSATLLFYNLSQLTERSRAVNLSATIIASLFSKDGLEDEKSLQELRAKATLLPGDTISPIEQFPWLTINKSDLFNLDARELRLKIFSQITGPIYDKGVSGAAAQFTQNPAEQEKFKKDATMLGVFTKATNEALKGALYASVVVAIIAAIATVIFSAGWGRLVSLGLILVLASPAGAIAGLLLRNPPKDGDAPLASLPASVTQTIGTSLSESYLVAFTFGAALLVVAFTGKIVQLILGRRAKSVKA